MCKSFGTSFSQTHTERRAATPQHHCAPIDSSTSIRTTCPHAYFTGTVSRHCSAPVKKQTTNFLGLYALIWACTAGIWQRSWEAKKWKGRGKTERDIRKLTVPLSSPRWLFCWDPRLCRGTVRCPPGCSGEDRSPKETGSPSFLKKINKGKTLQFAWLMDKILHLRVKA